MDTNGIKVFAQETRKKLQSQIEIKLNVVTSVGSIESIENPTAVDALKKRISEIGKKKVIEEAAYIWFNRFTALRFMDVNGYNSPMILSPLPGQIQPEILVFAKQLDFSGIKLNESDKARITGLLSGKLESLNPELEVYRILLLSFCNGLSSKLPFIFERVKDFTELLLPDDLLSTSSLTRETVSAMTEDDCKSVEIIGWLYQFYISEKKSEVQKKKKVADDEIAAVTQLFTPEWIVRYMVENSLGRLWMLNNPSSGLKRHMKFYIEPLEQKEEFIKISSPEDFRFCDPCCGSGHILVYAFDLLYLMYQEEGYSPSEAVSSIIKNNLYGIEIDDRAGQLTYFSLMMKAREKDRNFLEYSIKPNILVLRNYSFTNTEREYFKNKLGSDYTYNLDHLTYQFEKAKVLGSLIVPEEINHQLLKTRINSFKTDLFEKEAIERLKDVVNQAEYLSQRYNIVVTNPPYLGPSDIDDAEAVQWMKNNYPNTKTDTGVMFMERAFELVVKSGLIGMVNLHSWMFTFSYKSFRPDLLRKISFLSMIHIGTRGFDSISGEIVQTTSFIILNRESSIYGQYFKITLGKDEKEKQEKLQEMIFNMSRITGYYVIPAKHFLRIPGCALAYWVSERIIGFFSKKQSLFITRAGITSGDNETFIRKWFEISKKNIYLEQQNSSVETAWYFHHKGGNFRKWYGNLELVFHYDRTSIEKMETMPGFRHDGKEFFFREGATWNKTGTKKISVRFSDISNTFNTGGCCLFTDDKEQLLYVMGFLNSSVADVFLQFLCPTSSFTAGDVSKIPTVYDKKAKNLINLIVSSNIRISKDEWDSFETSWDFQRHPLIPHEYQERSNEDQKFIDSLSIEERDSIFRESPPMIVPSLKASWLEWEEECALRFLHLKKNEEELNRIFIDIYGLQDELKPEEEDSDVTVCKAELGRDIRSLISYAVGCMFGRYSLDKPGLQFAGGNWDSFDKSVFQSIKVDDDNAIPVLSGEYFRDDIVERFYTFIRVVYGDANYRENINFIESALGKTIRQYFVKDFYADHLKVYSNRPIYWMFSSPNGSFNALIYLHRYDKDTVGTVRNEYLMEYRNKLSQKRKLLLEKTDRSSLKEADTLQALIKELDDYDTDIMYPLATRYVELDLDDGVKVNYKKLGKALKYVKGLSEE